MPRTAPKNRPAKAKRAIPWKPPMAGVGRKKGVPNVVTSTVRGILTEFVEHNAAGAQALYNRVAQRNPAKALDIFVKVAEFVLPKLNRMEVNVDGVPLITPKPIEDATEAANVYLAIMGNVTLDLSQVKFAPPSLASTVVAEQTPNHD